MINILFQLIGMIAAIALFFLPHPALAQATKYYDPPASYSNAMLMGKDFSGQTFHAAEFSNANLHSTDFSNADLRGSVFSASVMTEANLHGANLSYGMADQVDFTRADLSDAIFEETLFFVSTFEDTNIAGADFTNAIFDGAQIKELCAKATGVNSQTGVSTRESLGCSEAGINFNT